MINQQLLDIINQQLQQGVSKDQIKTSLLSNGWYTQDINDSFNSLTHPLIQPITQNKATQHLLSQLAKGTKINIGIATIWPLFYIAILFISILTAIPFTFNIVLGDNLLIIKFLRLLFQLLLMFSFPTIILTIVLSILYSIIVFKDKIISKKQKTLWIIMFSLLSIFAMPIYWKRYIWKEPKED